MVAEQNRRHGGERRVQSLGQLSVLLQQGASLGGVGALVNQLPVLNLVLGATTFRLEGLVRESTGHDAVDEVDRLRLLRLSRLEGIRLDILDGAGVDLVAIALVGSMVAFEFRLRALCTVLKGVRIKLITK